jgi:hypothetical protein
MGKSSNTYNGERMKCPICDVELVPDAIPYCFKCPSWWGGGTPATMNETSHFFKGLTYVRINTYSYKNNDPTIGFAILRAKKNWEKIPTLIMVKE